MGNLQRQKILMVIKEMLWENGESLNVIKKTLFEMMKQFWKMILLY